jgi:N-acetylmuramoyl-L-alanine amidase
MKTCLATALLMGLGIALYAAGNPPPAKVLVKVEQRLIPKERKWRLVERVLKPEFITIHSTDNTRRGANAEAHAQLLCSVEGAPSESKLSRTGFRSWHFTVDDTHVVQHLPISEQGDHADFTGPGNQTSIGIEICVNQDGDLTKSVARAAALTAQLMQELQIDIEHVVPHYHWPQPPKNYQKACPSIFMEHDKPGKKWEAFKLQVMELRKQL